MRYSTVNRGHPELTLLGLIRGTILNRDLRHTQKTIYLAIFSNNIWSYLPRSPVNIDTNISNDITAPATLHDWVMM